MAGLAACEASVGVCVNSSGDIITAQTTWTGCTAYCAQATTGDHLKTFTTSAACTPHCEDSTGTVVPAALSSTDCTTLDASNQWVNAGNTWANTANAANTWHEPNTIGNRFFRLMKTNFNGASGTIQMDEYGTRDVDTANVMLYNLVSDTTGSVPVQELHRMKFDGNTKTWDAVDRIDAVSGGTILAASNLFEFADGTTAAPQDANVLNLALFHRITTNGTTQMASWTKSIVAASLLAVRDFNERNGRILADLKDDQNGGKIADTCLIKFDPTVKDTGSTGPTTMLNYNALKNTGKALTSSSARRGPLSA
jgi:hypothetical protein